MNVQVMSLTSSIYDYLIICPSSVTLTFNLPTYDFFHKESKSKKKKRIFMTISRGGGGGGGVSGGGVRVDG